MLSIGGGINSKFCPILNIGGMKLDHNFFMWIEYDKRSTRFWANQVKTKKKVFTET